MPKDISAILQSLIDKLKKHGKSEDDILRVVDEQGECLIGKDCRCDSGEDTQAERRFPIAVNYDLPLEEAINAGELPGVHSSITSQNFHRRGTVRHNWKLFSSDTTAA